VVAGGAAQLSPCGQLLVAAPSAVPTLASEGVAGCGALASLSTPLAGVSRGDDVDAVTTTTTADGDGGSSDDERRVACSCGEVDSVGRMGAGEVGDGPNRGELEGSRAPQLTPITGGPASSGSFVAGAASCPGDVDDIDGEGIKRAATALCGRGAKGETDSGCEHAEKGVASPSRSPDGEDRGGPGDMGAGEASCRTAAGEVAAGSGDSGSVCRGDCTCAGVVGAMASLPAGGGDADVLPGKGAEGSLSVAPVASGCQGDIAGGGKADWRTDMRMLRGGASPAGPQARAEAGRSASPNAVGGRPRAAADNNTPVGAPVGNDSTGTSELPESGGYPRAGRGRVAIARSALAAGMAGREASRDTGVEGRVCGGGGADRGGPVKEVSRGEEASPRWRSRPSTTMSLGVLSARLAAPLQLLTQRSSSSPLRLASASPLPLPPPSSPGPLPPRAVSPSLLSSSLSGASSLLVTLPVPSSSISFPC